MALPQRALGMRHAGLATEAAATATAAVRSATGDAVMEVVDLVKEEAYLAVVRETERPATAVGTVVAMGGGTQ